MYKQIKSTLIAALAGALALLLCSCIGETAVTGGISDKSSSYENETSAVSADEEWESEPEDIKEEQSQGSEEQEEPVSEDPDMIFDMSVRNFDDQPLVIENVYTPEPSLPLVVIPEPEDGGDISGPIPLTKRRKADIINAYAQWECDRYEKILRPTWTEEDAVWLKNSFIPVASIEMYLGTYRGNDALVLWDSGPWLAISEQHVGGYVFTLPYYTQHIFIYYNDSEIVELGDAYNREIITKEELDSIYQQYLEQWQIYRNR